MHKLLDWLVTYSGFLVAALVLVFGIAPRVSAQVPSPMVPTSISVLIIAPTGDPVTLPAIGAAMVVPIGVALNCNQAGSPPPALPLINPTKWEVDDPFTAGRVCKGTMPVGLPNGSNYRAVATFSGLCDGSPCTTPRSLVGAPPFTLQGPQVPGAGPSGLGVRP